MNHAVRFIVAGVVVWIASVVQAAEVSYNRDVRAILSDACFACHGPDANHRKKGLRLDVAEAATKPLESGRTAIVPGDAEASELVRRIFAEDADERMPPAESHKTLTAAQKKTLRDWVAQGARYEAHWSYIAPKQAEPPEVENAGWVRNAIDRFVLARLEAEGLSPSAEADRVTLIRRVTLDLTGLPPTPEEVDAFVADTSADTYEKVVDRLLASPHFGERLALVWLDAARYADTNGFSIDEHRDMWPWRDWVIDAFNRNMPFDAFITEQLAGDLLPGATERQKLATGFLRNSMSTHEGGTIPEEYRVTYIADKIDTVSSAMLGLTMRCAQCHDHKYDPITQEDFYRLFAYFGRSVEHGHGRNNANTPPVMDVGPVFGDVAGLRATLQRRIATLRRARHSPTRALAAERVAWEAKKLAELGGRIDGAGGDERAADAAFAFPPGTGEGAVVPAWVWAEQARDGQKVWLRRLVTLDAKPAGAKLFVCADDAAQVFVNGEAVGAVKQADSWLKPIAVDVSKSLKQGANVIAAELTNGSGPGGVLMVLAVEGDAGAGGDESPPASGADLRGLRSGLKWVVTDGAWQVTEKPVQGWEADARADAAGWRAATVVAKHGAAPYGDVYGKLTPGAGAESVPELRVALSTPAGDRTEAQWDAVVSEWGKQSRLAYLHANSIDNEIGLLRKQVEAGKVTVMVMGEEAKPRATYLLVRGQYDQPDKSRELTPGTPAALPTLRDDLPGNRLGLAEWLVDPGNPLTARVAVNRWWAMLFGAGLVTTGNDFGSQGAYPSHPELLDWLAREHADGGWDVKALVRLIVTSATYRQASRVTDGLRERDPMNRLLARQGRYRLAAELVRDNALAIGGLLDRTLGGPSVFPPQPEGLWREISHFGYTPPFTSHSFYADEGADARRRGLYTYWKRTSPPPGLAAFDAPTREVCTIGRATTNTPLAALVMLNDPQYVEAARGLAAYGAGDGVIEERIARMFKRATGRAADAGEIAVLRGRYERAVERYKGDEGGARAFLGGVEIATPQAREDAKPQAAAEGAAMVDVAAVILNLDETISRE